MMGLHRNEGRLRAPFYWMRTYVGAICALFEVLLRNTSHILPAGGLPPHPPGLVIQAQSPWGAPSLVLQGGSRGDPSPLGCTATLVCEAH